MTGLPQWWSNEQILAHSQAVAEAQNKVREGRQLAESDVVLLSPREMLIAVESGLCVGLGCPPKRRRRQ